MPLLSVVKTLFSHVFDVLSNVQSFQSEYGIMLRHLLAVRGYRFHMRKHIYCSEYQFLSPSETVTVNHCFTDFILYYFFQNLIWQGLLLLFMEKVELSLKDKNNNQYNHREDVFRYILTLHSLLENHPGDFPETLREDIVKGFVRIFSFMRYPIL